MSTSGAWVWTFVGDDRVQGRDQETFEHKRAFLT
jgi:hypothetical protein